MKITIAKPQLDEEEIKAVEEVIRSGMIASGPETLAFESEFAAFVGSKYACAVNNGTSALALALSSIGIKPGQEVITSPLTFVATANSIISCGAKPVFADIEESSFNLSPEAAEKAITENTAAIMPVHLYGLPAEMGKFRDISERYDIPIIGDAAQAHGASIGSEKVGTLSDMECFSFYPTKNMTTGEGGMVTTDDEELFNKMNSIRNHGRPGSQLGMYEHNRFGLNLRLTDIGSAIGRVQLRKLGGFNSARERNAKILAEKINWSEKLICPKVPDGTNHSWHQFTIRVVRGTDQRVIRDDLAKFLRKKEIGSGVYYPRLIQDYPHLVPFASDCPVAQQVVTEVLSLPVHAGLQISDVIEVADRVNEWVEASFS